MKKTAFFAALAAGLCISLSSFAQVPASAPAGSTGLCKDGSFTSAATKKGACTGHKGVKSWYAPAAAGSASGAATTAAPSTSATKPAATAAAPATSATKPAAATAAAPGGGAGQVWVNSKTKVYHCQGDRYYGKTKEGSYMSESAAKAAGDRPSRGKACS